MNIGILGGTFDPIHSGHLAIAEQAKRSLPLSQVMFIPAGQPWLKTDREITPAMHRKKMVELAIEGISYFRLSTVDIDRQGPSYTVDTITILQSRFGSEAQFFLILGWDSLNELPEWYQPEKLITMCKLVALNRATGTKPDLIALDERVPGLMKRTILLDMKPVDISSTNIRRRVARGLSIKGLVPETVDRYIREKQLYR